MKNYGKIKRKNSSSTILRKSKTPFKIRKKVTRMFEEAANVNVIFEREEESDNSKESLSKSAKEKAIFN